MSASPATNTSLFVHDELVGRKYRLVRMIGRGGMAEVWEAVNVDLDAPVAIKLTRPDVTDDVLARRMVQEAQAVAKLSHPAIVQVYDAGMHHGAPYVVMERLRGKSFREVIDAPQAPEWVFVVQTMIAILDALAYAHERGLVHRDVKPDNVFLATVGSGKTQPKLLDFGVVKLVQEPEHQLTQVGMALGSPAYMAPEQAAGRMDVDRRADLWGACITLCEALTQRQPFRAPNYNALMRKILEEPAPSLESMTTPEQRQRHPQLFAALAPILTKGLEKRRSQRWQSAGELAAALSQCLLDVGVDEDAAGNRLTQLLRASARPRIESSSGPRRLAIPRQDSGRAPRRNRRAVTAVGLALVLGGTAAAFVLSRDAEPASVAEPPASVFSGNAVSSGNALGSTDPRLVGSGSRTAAASSPEASSAGEASSTSQPAVTAPADSVVDEPATKSLPKTAASRNSASSDQGSPTKHKASQPAPSVPQPARSAPQPARSAPQPTRGAPRPAATPAKPPETDQKATPPAAPAGPDLKNPF